MVLTRNLRNKFDYIVRLGEKKELVKQNTDAH